MIITNELLEKLEKTSVSEVELVKAMKEFAKIAVEFCQTMKEKYRFKAKEDKILLASEILKDENIEINNLKVYYTHDGELIIKNGDELYFHVKLSEMDTLYYCLLSTYLFNNDEYEFDKKVNKMYHDEKLAKIGVIINDIYNVLLKD